MKWLAVFVLGGLGAACRVALSGLLPGRLLPWGTLAVNLAGCLAIGLLAVVFEERGGPLAWRVAVVGGLLGGFTTFSAFGLETWLLLQKGRALAAGLYAGGSILLGLLAVPPAWPSPAPGEPGGAARRGTA